MALSIVLYINTIYSATGRPIVSLKFTAFRVLLVLLPLAWLLMQLLDVAGVFVAIAVANLVSGLLAYFIFKRHFKVTG
jgi:Na+-driven multidrug efflux pump